MRFFLFIVFSFVSFSAGAQEASRVQVLEQQADSQDVDAVCDIQLSFGSYGSGIDHNAFKKTMSFIATNENFKILSSDTYGFEGDVAYCLDVLDGDVSKAFRLLKSMSPKTSKSGYTTIKTIEGHSFQTVWP